MSRGIWAQKIVDASVDNFPRLMRVLLYILWVSAVSWFHETWALPIPSQPDGYITDRAGLLSATTKATLEQTLAEFEQRTSTQIVVAIFPTLDGESVEEVSIRLAETWKIGQRGRDHGVILLIVPNDRRMRIEVGYGLEGVLTDAVSSTIINSVIAPRLRAGDFDGGVHAGVKALMEATQGEYLGSGRVATTSGSLLPVFMPFFIILLVVAIIDSVRYLIYATTHRRYRERFGMLGWWLRFAWLLALLHLLFRLLLQMILSGRGGYYGSRTGFGGLSSAGGGFAGGGGSFGGGGASGRW